MVLRNLQWEGSDTDAAFQYLQTSSSIECTFSRDALRFLKLAFLGTLTQGWDCCAERAFDVTLLTWQWFQYVPVTIIYI